MREASRLLKDPDHYKSMIVQESPFGDGHASERITDLIESFLTKRASERDKRKGYRSF